MYLTQQSYLHILCMLILSYSRTKIHIAWYSSVCWRRWSWGCTCHQLDGQKKTLNSTTTIVHSERKVMVNTTYHVYVRIVHKQSPHVHLHLSCHPRQFPSFICNWCTFQGEKDNIRGTRSHPMSYCKQNDVSAYHNMFIQQYIYLHGLFCSGTNRSYSHPTSLLE